MRFSYSLFLVPFCFAPVSAQVHSTPVKGPVALVDQRPLGKDIAAFPRVKSNAAVLPAIAAKINASLARLDAKVGGAAAECADEFKEQTGKRSVDGWQRSVTVTMTGPSYLSVQASDSIFCGGAHPSESFLPMVYDLSTGRPVDWTKLLPAGVHADTASTGDDVTVGVVTWDVLHDLAVKRASAECREVFQGSEDMPKQFVLSLDGRKGALVATAFDLPHVVAACAEPLAITAESARKLGVSSVLTNALIAATKLQ